MTDHPTMEELLAAAHGNPNPETANHLEQCRTCQVLLARLRDAQGLSWEVPAETPTRLTQASPTIWAAHPERPSRDSQPTTGDVWRTRAPESLLVWVRKAVSDTTIDVIPLTLDVDLADDRTLIVAASETPWGCDAAVFVDMRTHVDLDALESKLATLDVAEDVQRIVHDDVQHLTRPTGTPILSIEDQRMEYREVLRRDLDRFSPSSWRRDNPENASTPAAGENSAVPEDQLSDRIRGLTFLQVSEQSIATTAGVVTACRKVACLDAVVLICRLDSREPLANSDLVTDVARACRELVAGELDATAVAVFQPVPDQLAALFRRADLRPAIGLPSGQTSAPVPYLLDLPLADALFKHFDGYDVGTSWFLPERLSSLAPADISERASRHAAAAAVAVAKSGRAAIQKPKKAAFGRAHDYVPAIETFVQDVARGNVEEALETLKGDDAP